MKRLLAGGLFLAGLLWLPPLVPAQSTLDALDEELKEVKQQHDDATSQVLSNFFGQVDPAMASPDAAVALWQQAGGAMPAPTPVTTHYESETATERDTRLAQDKANTEALALVLQLHCGLLHYAALFVTDPKRKGLQDDFNAWLERAAQVYPQLSSGTAPAADADDQHHRHRDNGGAPPAPPFKLADFKGKTMKDSLISSFLSFKAWNDKDQGTWAVQDIPRLFQANILDPSRATPSQATLDAWDLYIAMAKADEPDDEKWTTTDYPPLQFERAFDAYAIAPGVDNLEVMVQIIHANPTHPDSDNWLMRTRALLDAYRAGRSAAVPAVVQNTAPAGQVSNGNVTITTQQQGDAQVITTHTNAAPVNPQ